MGVHKIKKGLDLPITGEPELRIEDGPKLQRVAVVADDFHGMKPRMLVQVGDTVLRGQGLFEDRKNPGVFHTSPGAGTVIGIHRGQRRALQSVVIELNDSERSGRDDQVSLANFTGGLSTAMTGEQVRKLLLESGFWSAFRTRPFSKVPTAESVPHSIFVTAMDSNPLAPPPDLVIQGREGDFERGLEAISKLTEGKTYLCVSQGSKVNPGTSHVMVEEFEGVHPAGTVGLHIHQVDPVHRGKTVWHIGYQEVIAIGVLVSTGKINVERVISLAGPQVENPRLLKVRMGASTDELTKDQLLDGPTRVISGSVLSGRTASGEIHGYLGRYHNQISAILEDRDRHFIGWLGPGLDIFSTIPAFFSRLLGSKKFNFTTTTHGSVRAMVPIGMYERVMPLDIMPTHLLRALAVGDTEWAEELGCLELDEEDLALCTFVCPGKSNYGPMLRNLLTQIEKEG